MWTVSPVEVFESFNSLPMGGQQDRGIVSWQGLAVQATFLPVQYSELQVLMEHFSAVWPPQVLDVQLQSLWCRSTWGFQAVYKSLGASE